MDKLRRSFQAFATVIYVVSSRAAPTNGPPSAASFYVHSLPELQVDPAQPPLRIWSGHLLSEPEPSSSSSTDVLSHLFFLLTKARRSADKERIIFWLNGGPGCSSFDGLMMEIGPWRVNGQGGLKMITGGWEEYAHVVYVDQPAGTGLSYASTDRYVKELTDVSTHFVQFLRNFYDVFPELLDAETYLAGESYAGQFIPYIADGIIRSNLRVPLVGLSIGNGWIDARRQYPAYVEFALRAGLFKEGSDAHKKSQEKLLQCQEALDAVIELEPVNVGVCEELLGVTLQSFNKEINGIPMCMNIYDIRLSDTSPACGMNWPPDLTEIGPYLGRKDVVAALHATEKQEAWQECSGRVGNALRNRKTPSSVTLLPFILSSGVQVMLFAGDQDMICNYVGQERLIENLAWNGATGMVSAETQDWTVNGTAAGTWQTARNLTYVKVFGASHMVGFDKPNVAHDMMLRFMNVDFSKVTEGSVRIPSSVGDNVKSGLPPNNDKSGNTTSNGKTLSEAEEKARWDAYYNAGTGALIFVLIALAVGLILYFRSRRQAKASGGTGGDGAYYGGLNGDAEESIPLTRNNADQEESRRRKGKGRASVPEESETMFEIGSDGEEKYAS